MKNCWIAAGKTFTQKGTSWRKKSAVGLLTKSIYRKRESLESCMNQWYGYCSSRGRSCSSVSLLGLSSPQTQVWVTISTSDEPRARLKRTNSKVLRHNGIIFFKEAFTWSKMNRNYQVKGSNDRISHGIMRWFLNDSSNSTRTDASLAANRTSSEGKGRYSQQRETTDRSWEYPRTCWTIWERESLQKKKSIFS